LKKRIGIFGWGVVGPKTPNVEAFEKNLEKADCWLEPFVGVGPNNFLVGTPDFAFEDYKPWIDKNFEPRRFAQLNEKMGNMVKYAIGAFIQSLGQNPGIEKVLSALGTQAHVYVGTGLGDYPKQYELSIKYYRAQQRWNEFWCSDECHPELASYRKSTEEEKEKFRAAINAPVDPESLGIDAIGYEDATEAWQLFWLERSDALLSYLDELREIESENIGKDIDASKSQVIRRKMAARKKLSAKYGAPVEPWNAVEANLLWNIANIPAAQISMLGHITGPAYAPVAACSTFSTALGLAYNAIQAGQAKAVVIGATDPEPHPLSVGTFYNARVLSNDGQVSKPLTGLRGTHVSGGACIWIVGDVDYMKEQGMKPIGLEILGVGVTSDADHIITPSIEGSNAAIQLALAEAGVKSDEIDTWDMHATATPGDWTEIHNSLEQFPDACCLTARKGTFGHGMSVCGGWELTAQHMGIVKGNIFPVNITEDELHPQIRNCTDSLVSEEGAPVMGSISGKINMGVGGINACTISRRWDDD